MKEEQIKEVDPFPQRSLLVAYLLWIFFGIFGAHRYYLDDNNLGTMFLCTLGFFGIGWCIDGLLIADLVEHCNEMRLELKSQSNFKVSYL